MKAFFSLATTAIIFLMGYAFSVFFETFLPILIFFFACLITGLYIKYMILHPTAIVKNIGWGLIYGSLTTAVLTIIAIVWVASLYS